MDEKRIVDIYCGLYRLAVDFNDGETRTYPLEVFPRLKNATQEQRRDWRLIGDGSGIHWPQIDEDLSAEGLLRKA